MTAAASHSDPPRNGWTAYEKLVLDKLDNHAERLEKIEHRMSTIQTSVALLKLKAAFVATAAAMGASVVVTWVFQVVSQQP